MEMNPQSVAIIVSLLLIGLGIAYAVIGWLARKSKRAVFRGLGVALIAGGLWIGGVMNMLFNGVQSLIAWYERQLPFDVVMWIAVGVAGLGVLFYLISMFLAPVTRAVYKERKLAAKNAAAASSSNARVAPAPAPRPAASTSTSSEDAEVDAILKARGIN